MSREQASFCKQDICSGLLNLLCSFLFETKVEGTRFIWDNITAGELGLGCLLAHQMGGGKTLQCIAVIHTFLVANRVSLRKLSSKQTSNFVFGILCLNNRQTGKARSCHCTSKYGFSVGERIYQMATKTFALCSTNIL